MPKQHPLPHFTKAQDPVNTLLGRFPGPRPEPVQVKGFEAESSLVSGCIHFCIRPCNWCRHQGGDRRCQLSQFSSVQCVQLSVSPWTAARQASLSITNSQSLLKLMSIESVMPSNHLILCHPLLLLPSVFPSIRGFPMSARECIMHIRELSVVRVHRLSQNPLSYALKEQASVCNDEGH